MPRVSVIIPSYNHEKYISKAIQSVLNQTYQDFEIVIVDDGSSDNTVQEIKKFSDPRIKLYCFEKNQGACIAVQKCLDEAQGEYISLLNSDDLYLLNKLEKQVPFLDEHPDIGAVFSYAQIIDEEGNDFTEKNHFYYNIFTQPNRNKFEWLNYFFYEGNCLCHPSILIRKECYNTIGFYDPRFAQLPDFDFWIRLCMHYEIHIMPEKLIKFRILSNEANASGIRPDKGIRSSLELSQILKNFLNLKKDDFNKVFPETTEENDSDLIPFLIARKAIEIDRRVYKNFAIDTIYQLLKDKFITTKIQVKYGFSYIDLIKMTGKYDIYNYLEEWVSSNLFIDTGAGYNGKQCVTQSIKKDARNFTLGFDVSMYSDIKSIRWDPVEDKLCKIKLYSVSYYDKLGQIHEIDLQTIKSNGQVQLDGSINFETLDPILILPIKGNILKLEINGTLDFFNIEEKIIKLKTDIYAKDDMILEKNNVITEKDNLILEQKSHIVYLNNLAESRTIKNRIKNIIKKILPDFVVIKIKKLKRFIELTKLIRIYSRKFDKDLHNIDQYLNSDFVIFIAHSDYLISLGGTEKYQLEDMQLCNEKNINVFQIFPEADCNKQFFGVNYNNEVLYRYLSFNSVIKLLNKLNTSDKLISYNMQHLLRWKSDQVAELINIIKNKTVITYLHDMYFVCQSNFLLFNDLDYCGAMEESFNSDKCMSCKHGPSFDTWKKLFNNLFEISTRIIYPSAVIEKMLDKNYAQSASKNKRLLIEHQKLSPIQIKEIKNKPKIRLAYLGYMAVIKGWNIFNKLAADEELTKTYEFYHIGSYYNGMQDNIKQVAYSLWTDGNYAPVDRLLSNDIDLVILWSTVPESYSYTLHEAYAAGIPVLTYKNSGNIALKVNQGLIYGKVFEQEKDLIEFLLDQEQVMSFINNNPNKTISQINNQSAFQYLIEKGEIKC